MRVAITSNGPGLNSQISPVFGRCPYFIFVDVENGKVVKEESAQNPVMMQSGGVGIAAAQFIANKGVKAVISGAVGPKAFAILQQLGIKIFLGVPGSVEENIRLFTENKLREAIPGPMGFGRGFGGGFGRGRRGWRWNL